MLTLVEQLGERGPVVLVIEDLHWADPSTRELLAFLVSNQRVLPGVLIVATFRSDELHRTHPLRPLLAELGRLAWVRRAELPRLTRRETAELLTGVLGREVEPNQADSVFARSEGNPLFAEELLCCDDELPDSLRDLVLARVQRLPAATQEVLRIASAAGERAGPALLQRGERAQ
jgi:predicted ATPase